MFWEKNFLEHFVQKNMQKNIFVMMISWWYHDLSERYFRLPFVFPQTWGTCFGFFRPDYYPRMTAKFGNVLIFWPNPCNDFGPKKMGGRIHWCALILPKKVKFRSKLSSNIFKIWDLTKWSIEPLQVPFNIFHHVQFFNTDYFYVKIGSNNMLFLVKGTYVKASFISKSLPPIFFFK